MIINSFLYGQEKELDNTDSFANKKLIQISSPEPKNDMHSKKLLIDIGFAPLFINYENISNAYNLFFGIGVSDSRNNLFCFNYFKYYRFHPNHKGEENDNFFSLNYYFIKSKKEKIKNYLGLQLGYFYSFGGNTPNPYYPLEIENYTMNFYSIGVSNCLRLNLSKTSFISLLVSLDAGILFQNRTLCNFVTGEELSKIKESYIDVNSFKPLLITYTYKF